MSSSPHSTLNEAGSNHFADLLFLPSSYSVFRLAVTMEFAAVRSSMLLSIWPSVLSCVFCTGFGSFGRPGRPSGPKRGRPGKPFPGKPGRPGPKPIGPKKPFRGRKLVSGLGGLIECQFPSFLPMHLLARKAEAQISLFSP